MGRKKSIVFVGSASEGLPIAEAVASFLESDFRAQLWKHGLFRPGQYSLESLEEALGRVSFAVIVGTPDDVLTKRGVTSDTVRDNLVLELGLFIGRLGRRRALLLVPEHAELALPSDLHGLTLAKYSAAGPAALTKEVLDDLQRAVGEVRKTFLEELAADRKAEKERAAKIAKSERLIAVRRLLKAVVQLRDLCIELPGKVLGSLDDLAQFEQAKRDISQQVAKLHEEWRKDAELLGVARQLRVLVSATQKAIEAFPHPTVVVSRDEATSVGWRALGNSLQAFGGGGGVADATDAGLNYVGAEIARKLQELGARYQAWWAEQAVELRRQAYELHEALAHSAVSLGLEGIDEPAEPT